MAKLFPSMTSTIAPNCDEISVSDEERNLYRNRRIVDLIFVGKESSGTSIGALQTVLK